MKIQFMTLLFCVAASLSSAADSSKRLLILGDSLTDGYGVAKTSAYPAVLEKKIQSSGKKWTVINAGISGSTSASAPSRLKWQLKNKPDLMILALGANDGLRGFDPKATEKNLAETIEMAQKEKVPVILAGMMMPQNYGAKYQKQFEQIYVDLASRYKLRRIPFLLDGVALDPKLNLADGIHPNEKGHEIIAEKVFSQIKDLL